MKMNPSFLKKALAIFLALQLTSFACPLFVPKAHALYWEDEGDDGNDPKEIKRRPSHFDMFDWVGDMEKDAKKKGYQDQDNHDKGPPVNNDDRTLELVTCGAVGLGAGLFLGYEFSGSAADQTDNMFIGGAVGLGLGVAVGALIMPHDYNVDQQTRTDFLKQRQAWLEDPVQLQVSKAFQPSQVSFQLQF
jgi:hypothetical protein